MTTKGLIAGFALAAISMIATSEAFAQTCTVRADNCVRNGGDRAQCHERQRMQSCERTGQYVAPSGRVWSATVKQKR